MRCLIGGVFAVAAVIATTTEARAQAEHYDMFRFDSGLTGTYVSASGRGGFGAVIEPKWYVHDNIAVGARFEGAVMFGGDIDQMSGDTQMDMGGVAAALAKGEYLVGTGPIRPFGGIGIGVFDIASQSLAAGPNTTGIDQKAGRYFGVSPSIGVDLGRLRLAATYNKIIGADIEVRQMIGNVEQKALFSQDYLTFEMSIRFGGRKKSTPPPPVIMVAPPPVMAPPPSAPPPPVMAPPPSEPPPAQ